MVELNVVVKRSEWLRGEGQQASFLLRGDKKMCCMGFAEIARGCSAKDILNCKAVTVICYTHLVSNPDVAYSTIQDLYLINDAEVGSPLVSSEQARESLIIETGKRAHINFSFED